MNKIKHERKVIAAALVLILIVSTAMIPVSAAVADPITPLWDNLTSVRADISFMDVYGTATGTAVATGSTITATLSVYEDGGSTPIYTQTKTASNRLTITIEFEGEYFSEYTAEFTVTATKNGVSESGFDSASAWCE